VAPCRINTKSKHQIFVELIQKVSTNPVYMLFTKSSCRGCRLSITRLTVPPAGNESALWSGPGTARSRQYVSCLPDAKGEHAWHVEKGGIEKETFITELGERERRLLLSWAKRERRLLLSWAKSGKDSQGRNECDARGGGGGGGVRERAMVLTFLY